jgi:hypothetical protein
MVAEKPSIAETAFALRWALGRGSLGLRTPCRRVSFFCGVEDPGIVFQLLDFHVSHFSECRAYFLSLLYFRFSLVFLRNYYGVVLSNQPSAYLHSRVPDVI